MAVIFRLPRAKEMFLLFAQDGYHIYAAKSWRHVFIICSEWLSFLSYIELSKLFNYSGWLSYLSLQEFFSINTWDFFVGLYFIECQSFFYIPSSFYIETNCSTVMDYFTNNLISISFPNSGIYSCL